MVLYKFVLWFNFDCIILVYNEILFGFVKINLDGNLLILFGLIIGLIFVSINKIKKKFYFVCFMEF